MTDPQDTPQPTSRRAAREAQAATTAPLSATPPIEELFAREEERPAAKREKRGRGKGCLVLVIIFVVLLGGIAAGGVWAWNTFGDRISEELGWGEPKDFEAGEATGEAAVTILDGDGGEAISTSLFEAGVTKTPSVFYDMLLKMEPQPFHPGVYALQQKMTAAAALEALLDPANKQENAVLLREGLTVAQSVPVIAESLGLPLEDVQAAVADPAAYGVTADSLEGWLFPAMYEFDPDVTATDVITTMVNRAVKSLDDAGVPEADRHRVLTVASIIQREARFEADFYKVSRVIENRLDESNQETFGKLQMDSTAQFGYGEMHDGSVSSSAEALADPNPWNTYVHAGLPIGPIANPGDMAIDAAMHPADGPWLYFVTVNLDTGLTEFSNTYSEHLRFTEQWQSWCRENPDSGC